MKTIKRRSATVSNAEDKKIKTIIDNNYKKEPSVLVINGLQSLLNILRRDFILLSTPAGETDRRK